MWWDVDKSESKSEYLARVKYDEIVSKSASSFMDIVGSDLPANVQYRIVTNQGFNAITVIEYLCDKYELTDIYVAVYRMNLRAVNKLKTLLNNSDISCKIILSSFFRENKKYERWCSDLISYANGCERATVSFAWNHAKVFLAKTRCGKHIVFEGSGNLSDNARIEQYLIEDNETTYLFHKAWIEQILND